VEEARRDAGVSDADVDVIRASYVQQLEARDGLLVKGWMKTGEISLS
jgi:hypothetical protein